MMKLLSILMAVFLVPGCGVGLVFSDNIKNSIQTCSVNVLETNMSVEETAHMTREENAPKEVASEDQIVHESADEDIQQSEGHAITTFMKSFLSVLFPIMNVIRQIVLFLK